MNWQHPEWGLLLPVLVAVGWYWRGLQLHKPLRAALVLLLVVMAAGPEWRRFSDGLDLWVLVDRSDSAEESLGGRIAEWETLLRSSKGSEDRLRFVDFATETLLRSSDGSGEQGRYSGPTASTRMKDAILHALSAMEDRRANRLLVFSDGMSTEPLDGLSERLRAESVPLDYRLTIREGSGDWRLASLEMPQQVQPEEAFLIEATVLGDRDGVVRVEVLREGQSWQTEDVEIVDGMGRLRLATRLRRPGATRFEARLFHPEDAVAGNNLATQWVEVRSGPRVLMVTRYQNDPLARALAAQGFEVEQLTDPKAAHQGLLSGAKVVLMNNVPAYEVPTSFLKALDFFVSEQGGGLAMIGGQYSFASGGYFGSAVEPLLPVSMELKQEHRKLMVAMAIVMDRSGSMGMTVPGSGLTKMQLANEGAGRAIELLGETDFVTVQAVDSEAHTITPAVPVGPNRGQLMDVVRRIDSGGGGIYVYNGLKAAWSELEQIDVGQRHIILFSDAADSEQPGQYRELIDEMVAEKTSVSVIGLGTDSDADAAFLEDIATRGGGRIFFNTDANELPALFAQETVAVARSTFIEEPVEVKGTPGWAEMAAGRMDWLSQVDGYNLSYLRPGASQAAVSGDEYAAPLLAFWQRGAGRTAAVAFPLGGDFSTLTRSWPGYGGMVRSLTRWLMGETLPPGLGLRTRVEGSVLKADLFFSEEWNERLAQSPPVLKLTEDRDPNVKEIPWVRLAPGHYEARIDLEQQTLVRGAVRVGAHALPFGPLNLAADPEWRWETERLQELREISLGSGGGERLDLSRVWEAERPPAWTPLLPWLLLLFLALLLLEAWQTRAGWRLLGRGKTL